MKRTYYKNPTYAAIIFLINALMSIIFITGVIYAMSRTQGFHHELFWMSWSFALVFFILFMMHFFYIGVFSMIVLSENNLSVKKTFNTDTIIKYKNINRIEIINEMRLHFLIVDRPVILVEGYDEVTKKNVTVKINYRKKVHDILVDRINDADKKTLMNIDKYFDMHL